MLNTQRRRHASLRETSNACLRDRLCLLIRQHQLDPTLSKLYATVSAVPRKQPLNRLPKLLTDPQEYFCPDLHLPVLHRGEVVLAHSYASRKFLLSHIESPQLTDTSPNHLPVDNSASGMQLPP